ncbi:MAG: endonuclease [Betaproteobacteria bacterium]|nr:endonuclease [Betaproteobacteria bacterium]
MTTYSADDLILLARKRLSPDHSHTASTIRQVVERLAASLELPEADVVRASRQLETLYQTTMEFGHTLTERGHRPWLTERMRGAPSPYWDRYRCYLEQDKQFAPQVVLRMDAVLNRVLDLCGDPSTQPLDRRGLVVGQVQSGKTANYTGLICKAVDAGFRAIFVIAGIHNNLRAQTQKRIDEGFIGRDSLKRTTNAIGAARIRDDLPRPTTFTNAVRDFNGAFADQIGFDLANTGSPAVFVVKKNAKVLRKLNDWLSDHSRKSDGGIPLPALIIDDEADNASINIGRDGQISAINGQIRKLLKLFPRSSYIGYTATPFANIFIDPRTNDDMLEDDLFPRSFIVALEPPSNYHGPERIFGCHETSDRQVKVVSDYQDLLPLNHKRSHVVDTLPASLESALDAWFAATTIRYLRSSGAFHSTMMVHVSRFVDVQGRVADLVRERVDAIIQSIRARSRMPQADQDLRLGAIKVALETHYPNCCLTWKQVCGALADAVPSADVKVINGASPDALDFSGKQARCVAIGGTSLSRGITLEGLTASYFLRSSKMYDTLMQMGRWFGYRDGYEDLVRIWLTPDSKGWYEHVTEVVTELRQDLIDMERFGGTPLDFGLKVRTHPESLLITARNKMGSSQTYVHSTGLSNRCIELHEVSDEASVREHNFRIAIELLRSIHAECGEQIRGSPPGSGCLVRNVPVEFLLKFLSDFKTPEPFNPAKHPRNLKRFIADSKDPRLSSWLVFVPFGQGSEHINGSPLADHLCLRRSQGKRDGTLLSLGDKHRVSGRGIEAAGLSALQIDEVRKSHADQDPPDHAFRRVRPEPLFMLFFVNLPGAERAAPTYVSFGISIPPGVSDGEAVEYQVNQTFLAKQLELFGQPDDESEEED